MFRAESQEFLKGNVNLKDFDRKVFESAVAGAMRALDFSFFATLSYSLGLKFPKSRAWEHCEAEELAKMLESGDAQGNPGLKADIAGHFAYYSPDIYDVQAPRISEAFPQRLVAIAPQNPQMRLRENAKFCLGKYMFVLRRQLLLLGRQEGLGELVFHMKIDEALQLAGGANVTGAKDANAINELRGILEKRKAVHEYLSSLASSVFPARFIYDRKSSSWLEEKTGMAQQARALLALAKSAFSGGISTGAVSGKSDSSSAVPASANPGPNEGKAMQFAGIGVGGAGIASGEAVFISSKADYSKGTKG
ncbi:MAG TPA: hypothetical protein PLO51_06195, partial [Candidatus Micrarchaeota archaeon]|nr:hypothetical protein [Candidatus Micrarchaeota archaeon]